MDGVEAGDEQGPPAGPGQTRRLVKSCAGFPATTRSSYEHVNWLLPRGSTLDIRRLLQRPRYLRCGCQLCRRGDRSSQRLKHWRAVRKLVGSRAGPGGAHAASPVAAPLVPLPWEGSPAWKEAEESTHLLVVTKSCTERTLPRYYRYIFQLGRTQLKNAVKIHMLRYIFKLKRKASRK